MCVWGEGESKNLKREIEIDREEGNPETRSNALLGEIFYTDTFLPGII